MTDRLQHLLQLQKEEASKLTAILRSIADGVIVQDLKGDILVINPAAEKILEGMGNNFIQAARSKGRTETPLSPQAEQDPMAYLLNNLTSLEFRETGRLEVNPHLVLSALSAPVLTPEGNELGSVVVLRDITREVESEKLKDEFITSISHELKTPLTAIKGYNSLLKMMLQMGSSDKMGARQLSIIETMEKELNDLDNLIQAMLDLSQIDADELGIDREPIDLSALVEQESENWKDKMEARDLSFTTHLPEETIWIEGDQSRLTRVLRNLLKNAHDYTLPGGTVEVAIERENGKAQIYVKDNGVGISEEDQRFIFKRFFRAIHQENTFEVSGAGLGLYTSKAIVKAHGGELEMESMPNRGSTFSFALPIIDEPHEDDEYGV
jgi:signal transduction histidine kinase